MHSIPCYSIPVPPFGPKATSANITGSGAHCAFVLSAKLP